MLIINTSVYLVIKYSLIETMLTYRTKLKENQFYYRYHLDLFQFISIIMNNK